MNDVELRTLLSTFIVTILLVIVEMENYSTSATGQIFVSSIMQIKSWLRKTISTYISSTKLPNKKFNRLAKNFIQSFFLIWKFRQSLIFILSKNKLPYQERLKVFPSNDNGRSSILPLHLNIQNLTILL